MSMTPLVSPVRLLSRDQLERQAAFCESMAERFFLDGHAWLAAKYRGVAESCRKELERRVIE